MSSEGLCRERDLARNPRLHQKAHRIGIRFNEPGPASGGDLRGGCVRLAKNGQPGFAGRLLDGMRCLRDGVRRMRKGAELRRKTRVRPLRIVIGSGGVPVEGWILTDIDQLDILDEGDWRTYFSPGSIDSILAEHVWEHLTVEDGTRAAKLCRM